MMCVYAHVDEFGDASGTFIVIYGDDIAVTEVKRSLRHIFGACERILLE